MPTARPSGRREARPTPGDRIDLRRLPAWLQYTIALAVVAVVAGLAWLVGRDDPLPDWMTGALIPALGWLYIVLFIIAIVIRLTRK